MLRVQVQPPSTPAQALATLPCPARAQEPGPPSRFGEARPVVCAAAVPDQPGKHANWQLASCQLLGGQAVSTDSDRIPFLDACLQEGAAVLAVAVASKVGPLPGSRALAIPACSEGASSIDKRSRRPPS